MQIMMEYYHWISKIGGIGSEEFIMINNTCKSSLQGVASTLFIPLEARIFASKKFPEYFYDDKALSLEKYISNDRIRKKSSEYSLMASVARYYNMDTMVRAFIRANIPCNIVYLGAGLETAYYRLNEENAMFYEVDLPEVIDSRRTVLGQRKMKFCSGGICLTCFGQRQ